ncbi:Ig-like domain-containing protein [Ectobacillus polymachus]|uniref:Ig-like domain-containing protein n=1 Tax=Ectobacillus polymachus TaxID=1508806 RepID=UPI003A86F092
MVVLVIILVFTPFMVSITHDGNGNLVPTVKYQRALALANVGILGNQTLNGSYDPSTGNLSLKISGGTLLSLGALDSQSFIYQLPEELKFILDDPRFKQNARIDFEESWLLGSTSDTIDGSSLTLNSADGTVTGVRNSVLDLSLLATVTVTLMIKLSALDVAKLPPSPDGILEFYGLASKEALIDLSVLVSEGSKYDMRTDVLPPPPTVNSVSDVDTVVTGTGEAGATVHIVTPSGNYEGLVNEKGSYSIAIPVQDAGTVITATQTVAGIESKGVSTTVIGVILDFTVPSEIQFQNTPIKLQEVTIPRVDPNWSIAVRDTRGQGSKWAIKAKATGPLTSTDGYTLDPNALVYVKGNSVESLNDEVLIYEGTTGVEQKTTVQWGENEGILMKLTPTGLFDARTGVTYSTTIHWTLENAP